MAKSYGRWKTVRSLSEGGQAFTFIVVDPSDPECRHYVLKRLKNSDRLERFAAEVAALQNLNHPNIINILESDLESDKPFYVMDYCDGGPLSKLDFSGWSTIERLELFLGICRGVGAAHTAGIIHRDIKPDNLFINGDGRTPIIGDFGICFFENGDRITLTNEAAGPRLYIAPELEDGRANTVSTRADVYSLGKTLYFLFSKTRYYTKHVFAREGHRESHGFQDRDIAWIYADFPVYLLWEHGFINQLLDRSICASPNDRFADANVFAKEVERTIHLIQANAHTLDFRDFQRCSYCGIGRYLVAADTDANDTKLKRIDQYGITPHSEEKWVVLCCGNCGHLQLFRLDKTTTRGQVWTNRTY